MGAPEDANQIADSYSLTPDGLVVDQEVFGARTSVDVLVRYALK